MFNLKKLAVWTLLATFIIPFIVAPNVLAPCVAGKVLFLRGIIFLVFFLITCILLFSKDKDEIFSSIKEMTKDPIFITLSVSVFLLVLSTLFAYDKRVAFFGQPERYEGFVTLFSIYLYYIAFRILFKRREWNTFFILVSFSAIGLFIIEVVQALGGVARPEALSGNPDFLAIQYLFSIFAGFLVYIQGREKNKKWYQVLGLSGSVLSFLGIMLSKTRGPLVGIIASVLIVSAIAAFLNKEKIILNKYSLKKIGKYVSIITLFIVLLVGVTYKSPFWHYVPGVNRVVEISVNDGSTQARLMHIDTSIEIFTKEQSLSRALLGWGWDNYIFAWGKYYNPKVFYYDPAIVDRSHNKIADQLVMTGLLGLISYLSIWFFAIKKVFNKMREKDITVPFLLLFFFVAYCSVNIFHSSV